MSAFEINAIIATQLEKLGGKMDFVVKFFAVIVVLAKIAEINCTGNSGPVGPFNIFEVGACTPDINNVNFIGTLTDTGDGKSVSLDVDLPFDINDETYLVVILDKWEANTWKEEFLKMDGPMFDLIDKYIPLVFENINALMDPPMPPREDKSIPAGKYSAQNFEEVYSSLEIPQTFYGRFKLRLTLSDDTNDDFLCIHAEYESEEP